MKLLTKATVNYSIVNITVHEKELQNGYIRTYLKPLKRTGARRKDFPVKDRMAAITFIDEYSGLMILKKRTHIRRTRHK